MANSLKVINWDEVKRQAIAEYKSMVIVGQAGCGKTTVAKHFASKPALFVTHMDILKQFKPNFHKSIIFDDVSFAHLPRETNISIVDTEQPRAIHVRYGVAEIPERVEKWFTCNRYPFVAGATGFDPAIERRIKVLTFKE